MKIKNLKLERFMLFDTFDITWSSNINIICGENNTGKTTLLKVLYSMVKPLGTNSPAHLTKDQLENVLVGKMLGVFRPEGQKLGRLVSRKQGSHQTSIGVDFDNGNVLQMAFGYRHECHAQVRYQHSVDFPHFETVYLPPKEMISATEHFQSLYEAYHIDFEEMYYDLTKLLAKPLKRGAHTPRQQQVLTNFESILNGKIQQKNKLFYLKTPEGTFEMGLVSEGYRKLATMIYLISSGSLDENAILFWDEPETNMNPKMIQPIVAAIIALAKMGVQVFVTTHDYFILQSFNLLATYPEINTHQLQLNFISLYKDGVELCYEVANDLSGLSHNAIMEEFDALYDREQAIIYGD